ncbi:hypothetical protein [Gilvimarinus japonicus]|jgi:hypothetical protein|uniref:Uncharacterized protein n=1 Tax=Gilvimarinus japonicus TaxID=1796469 RepID=A0ABV7HPP9_9GAMM
MKFIDDRDIPGCPFEFVSLFTEKGILAKHNSEFQNARFHYMEKNGIWVLLNTQYEDATILLTKSSHKVNEPLSQDQMSILEREAKKLLYRASSRFFSVLAKRLFYIVLLAGTAYLGFHIIKAT